MFKRPGAILLIALYLTTVVGFVVNLRYCGRMITAVKIDTPVSVCKITPVIGKMKCCTERQINVQVKDSHQGEFHTFLGKLFSFQMGRLSFAKMAFNSPVTNRQVIKDKAPPDDRLNATPVFIQNCNFRI